MNTKRTKREPKDKNFEVVNNYYRLRRDFTDLIFRDFGFSLEKFERDTKRKFGENLSSENKDKYDSIIEKYRLFYMWYMNDERDTLLHCLRSIGEEIFEANSITPTYMEELIERRLHQDRAIGQCNRLEQELQYTIETLPVDINKYKRFNDMIQLEIKLIKGWRKSDNKFKDSFKVTSMSASNFANVNSNGNANYNTASNSNGVRPDSEPIA